MAESARHLCAVLSQQVTWARSGAWQSRHAKARQKQTKDFQALQVSAEDMLDSGTNVVCAYKICRVPDQKLGVELREDPIGILSWQGGKLARTAEDCFYGGRPGCN